jgi:Domain of unknown function (DUF6777)
MSQTMPPPPPPPPAPASTTKRGVEPWVYWLIGALAVALIVTVVVMVTGGGEKEAATTVTTTSLASTTTAATTTTLGPGEAPGEVFLEPAGTLGPDSYTDRVHEGPVVSTTAPVTTTSTTVDTTTTLAGVAVTSRFGGEPGLYGGTGDQARCDKDAILSYLQQNPDKAAAWVRAQNNDPTLAWDDGRTDLTVADLPDYFAELTPVTLIYDTRVTNHGFRDGLPTARQSVLQAGTAVLIDIYGVPRARCACGNPLIPPIATPRPPTWVGPPWPDFDPTIVIVVVPAPTIITQVVIVDLGTGSVIIRPVGTTGAEDTIARTGDVQVTLIWNHDSDMDLHVVDPEGVEIYFANSTSPTGGELDVDKIPSAGDAGPHVENIYWPPDGAPPGTYTAFVNHFDSYTGASGSYTLEIRVGGVLVHQESGSIAEDADSPPVEFLVETG